MKNDFLAARREKKYEQIGNSSEIFEMKCPNSAGNWRIRPAQLISRCKFSDPGSCVLPMIKRASEKYSDRNIRIYG